MNSPRSHSKSKAEQELEPKFASSPTSALSTISFLFLESLWGLTVHERFGQGLGGTVRVEDPLEALWLQNPVQSHAAGAYNVSTLPSARAGGGALGTPLAGNTSSGACSTGHPLLLC